MDKFNKALEDYNANMGTTYDCLKDKQIDVINAILKGDVLAILPTGFGKGSGYIHHHGVYTMANACALTRAH